VCDTARGETTCNNCGLVIEEYMVDMGPEWRTYTAEDRKNRSRVGSPISYAIHDKGLSTMICRGNRDAKGRKLSLRRRIEVYRLRKWQKRTRIRNIRERTLVRALSALNRLVSQLGIPRSIKEEAAIIYRRAWDNGLSRGIAMEILVAAALYTACRTRRIPRTLDEIAEKAHISKKQLGQWFRRLVRKMKISIPLCEPMDFISRFSTELKLSGKVAGRAIELLEDAKEEGITTGKVPTGLAATALYIAGILENERRTQREISRVGQVTEVTVRNRYKEFVENLEIEVMP
jgi:transcription initiation factor TFIIB